MDGLRSVDPDVAELIAKEARRRETTIDLIASESEPSPPVLEALGSVFAAKTAEGYPGRRYHRGTENADVVEQLAIDRARAAARTTTWCSWTCAAASSPATSPRSRSRRPGSSPTGT